MTGESQARRPVVSAKRRRVYILIMLLCWLVVFAVVGMYAWKPKRQGGLARGHGPRIRRPVSPSILKDEVTHPLFDDDAFVWDERTYVRPRAHYAIERVSISITGEKKAAFRVTHVERGIIRHESVGPQPGKPTVLLLGDSHIYATVDLKRHVYYLLEQALREDPRREKATVINAGCPFYSLYQYVLRARTLWDYVKPDVVVVISLCGQRPVGDGGRIQAAH